jgi:hypothetical protein
MVGVHPQNSLTASQMQAQQQAQVQASDRAKLRSRKPTDKNIPEGVEDCVIGDGVLRYREIQALERRLDATMMRKRLDLQDSVNRNVKVCWQYPTVGRCVNLYVAHTNNTNLDQQYRRRPALASRCSRYRRLRLHHKHGLFVSSKD